MHKTTCPEAFFIPTPTPTSSPSRSGKMRKHFFGSRAGCPCRDPAAKRWSCEARNPKNETRFPSLPPPTHTLSLIPLPHPLHLHPGAEKCEGIFPGQGQGALVVIQRRNAGRAKHETQKIKTPQVAENDLWRPFDRLIINRTNDQNFRTGGSRRPQGTS